MSQPIHLFKTALGFTLKWEGNAGHPTPQEGAIQKGITQTTYDTYRRHKGLALQPVRKISLAEVEQVYRELFWNPSQAELMSLPLAVVHFDTAVNVGVQGSIEFLQAVIGGLVVDGIFGPKTTAALKQASHLEIAKNYCQRRLDFRYQQVHKHPSQHIFLEGWLQRDKDLLSYITQLSYEPVIPAVNFSINSVPVEVPVNHSVPAQSEKQKKAIAKLEQAINLLQEVVETLKQPEE